MKMREEIFDIYKRYILFASISIYWAYFPNLLFLYQHILSLSNHNPVVKVKNQLSFFTYESH